MILKMSAVIKPSTLKPSTNLSQIKMIMALITSKNKPSEKIVIGNVKNTNIGFTIALSKPKTIATINDVLMPFSR